MKNFFISYNQADRDWAAWIGWQLESAGWSVVLQDWDFHEGQNFVLEMQRAIEQTQRTIVVLSPDFLASRFTAPEWAAAFARDPTGALGSLLPVRVRPCEPTGLLAQLVYIDLVGITSREQARSLLLEAVQMLRGKPETEPAMPMAEPPPLRSAADAEPDWPGRIGAITGSTLKRIVRASVVAIGGGIASLLFLQAALPEWFDRSTTEAASAAVFLGFACSVLVEGLLSAVRRGVEPRRIPR